MSVADLRQRFEQQYTIAESGCWEWTGARTHGYGQIKASCRTLKAHRVAYELYVGPIPKGMMICHRCDNPRCVNPKHLFPGTAGDNSRDMHRKGRAYLPTGEHHKNSRLTVSAVMDIRSSPATGISLSKRYGVSRSTVSRVRNYRLWNSL